LHLALGAGLRTELNKRCRPHLKPTNKSYRTDETYIKVKGEDKYLYRAVRESPASCWSAAIRIRTNKTVAFSLCAILRTYNAEDETPDALAQQVQSAIDNGRDGAQVSGVLSDTCPVDNRRSTASTSTGRRSTISSAYSRR